MRKVVYGLLAVVGGVMLFSSCDFSPLIFPSYLIPPICPIRPINFLTKPERPCERATLGSSVEPNENAQGALLQAHSASMISIAEGKLKKGSTRVLPLAMQRYDKNEVIANQ
jgi:hypothetical protein